MARFGDLGQQARGIVSIAVIYISCAVMASDEQSLLAIKAAVADPQGVLSSWSNASAESLPVCNWTFVTCDQNLRVTELWPVSQSLGGIISPAIGGLTSLRYLNLSGNFLTGLIPSEIGNCSALRNVSLSSNFLTGTVPSTFDQLISLGCLDLSSNNLTGQIPAFVGNLASLKCLRLPNNTLTGHIPVSFGNLTALEDIDLSGNFLRGMIPTSLGNLTALTSLALSSNFLTGSIPVSLGNLGALEAIDLKFNILTDEIPASLGNLTRLQRLDLSSNTLKDQIPASLGSCSNLYLLNLTSNLLSGPIPRAFGNLGSLSRLHLSSNSLTGGIPTELFNRTGRLGEVMAAHNNLSGHLPDQFDKLLNLSSVDLSYNLLSGELPPSLGMCAGLLSLSLSHNLLSGEIPSTIGRQATAFQISLNLSFNSLSGQIPAEIANLGSITTSLDLSVNKLIGPIPNFTQGDPLNCANLQVLDLSRNSLSGEVNESLRGCSALEMVDLSANNLTGPPPDFGSKDNFVSCARLQTLNLSRNFISGEISQIESLVQCSALGTLDLSYNSLTGNIEPQGLAYLSNLTFLNLSNNHLEGSIDALRNITSASFLPGNDGLCGLILGRKCPKSVKRLLSMRAVGAGSAITLFLFVVVVGLVSARAINRRNRGAVTSYSRGFDIIHLSVQDLITATEDFNVNRVLGRGGTSIVYMGLLPFYPFVIAVKKFEDNERGRQRVLQEAGILKVARHVNLVGSLGLFSVPRDMNVLILDYMSNGTLHQHLYEGEGTELSFDARLNIVKGVATGICYLHEDSSPQSIIIHGDLKPANIFLDAGFSAKIGDFGLSKLLAKADNGQHIQHTWEGTFGYSPPGDVYSFGVIVLEILTRKRPSSYSTFEEWGGFIHWVRAAFREPDTLLAIVYPRLSEDMISKRGAMELLFRVGLLCTREDPRARPTMKEALDMVITIVRGEMGPEAASPNPLPPIQELIDESSLTSFQQAKSWGWLKQYFKHDFHRSSGSLERIRSDLYYDSWFSLFKLDMRDSRMLRAIGFDTDAVTNLRRQTLEKRKLLQKRARKGKLWKFLWSGN